jgi:predicted kinase
MQLIIVQGKTATGKTHLANRLSKDLGIAAFIKDGYKEKRFDALGKVPNLKQWVDIENESWRQLHEAVQEAIHKNTSLIIEGNFVPKERKKLRKLIPTTCNVVEIFCFAKGRVLSKRYVQRNRSGERHPGHRDHLWYGVVFMEMAAAGVGAHWIKPVRVSDKVLKVDTTDFSKVDHEKIVQFIKTATAD